MKLSIQGVVSSTTKTANPVKLSIQGVVSQIKTHANVTEVSVDGMYQSYNIEGSIGEVSHRRVSVETDCVHLIAVLNIKDTTQI